MTPWMALGTCTHPTAVDRSARPCRESTSPACARRSANKVSGFQRPELSRPDLVLTLPDRPYPDLTSTHGKGAWPATDAAAGGDRAGLGWRGLLQRVRGLLSLGSPPAVGVERGQSACIAHWPAPSAAGTGSKGSVPGPAKPQQGCPPDAGGKRPRGAIGFVETVFVQTLRTMSGAPRPFPIAQRETA